MISPAAHQHVLFKVIACNEQFFFLIVWLTATHLKAMYIKLKQVHTRKKPIKWTQLYNII